LFAPVAFNYAVARPAGWYYRPSYVLQPQPLLAAMFARPAFGHYYFGDYFGQTYRQAGYVPWIDYHVARNVPNPNVAYYHWRHDRDLLVDLRQTYKLREEGRAPRPPVSVKNQTQIIEHITNNKTVVINNQTIRIDNPKTAVQHLTMVTPLTKVEKNVKFLDREVKLEKVSKEVLVREQKHVTEVRKVAAVRRDFDAKHVHVEPKKGVVEPKKAVVHPKLTLPAHVAHQEAVKPKLERPPHPKPPAHSEKHVAEPRKEVKTPRIEVRPKGPAVAPKLEEKKPAAPPKELKPPVVPKADDKKPAPPPKELKPPVNPKADEKKPAVPPKFEDKKAAPPREIPDPPEKGRVLPGPARPPASPPPPKGKDKGRDDGD